LKSTPRTQKVFRIGDLGFRMCSSRIGAAIRTRCAPIRNSQSAVRNCAAIQPATCGHVQRHHLQ
jgi:hypothetical protein